MGELVVARWTRYGKDRLYVNAGTDRIGWVDLQSGSHVLERADLADHFAGAVIAYCLEQGLRVPEHLGAPTPRPTLPVAAVAVSLPPSARPTPVAAAPAPAAEWEDLAGRIPGQAARARAEEELMAARAQSRVGTFLARAFDVKTDERNWRVGADGEETVGARLEKLRKHGWHLLHAVPVGTRGSDIDHVVIGPGGVWTVNTKTHKGKSVWVGRNQVRVDGHKQDYLRNSRHEAERATRLLTEACGFPVFAKAALVFLTGTLIPDVTIKQRPDDVAILDRTDIPGAFRRAPVRLDDEQVEAIYAVARRSTTWTT